MKLKYAFPALVCLLAISQLATAQTPIVVDFQASGLSNGTLKSFANPTSRGTALKNAYSIISNFGGQSHSQSYWSGGWQSITFPANGGLELGSSMYSYNQTRSLMLEHPRDFIEFGPFPTGIPAGQVIFTLNAYNNSYAKGRLRVTVLDASKQGVGVDSSGAFFEVSSSQFSTSPSQVLCIFPNAVPAGGYVHMKRSSLYGVSTSSWPNGNFYLDEISFTPNPVPVELVAFRGMQKNGMVELHWRTATELNNYGFEVQRSADKNNWDVLGFVYGAGNSFSPRDYSFTDESPLRTSEKLYYRLRQIDRDGTSETTQALGLEMSGVVVDFAVNAHPQPFSGSLNLTIESQGEQWASIALYNSVLQKIKVVYEGSVAGTMAVPVETTDLFDGNYFLVVQREGQAPLVRRVVKITQ